MVFRPKKKSRFRKSKFPVAILLAKRHRKKLKIVNPEIVLLANCTCFVHNAIVKQNMSAATRKTMEAKRQKQQLHCNSLHYKGKRK